MQIWGERARNSTLPDRAVGHGVELRRREVAVGNRDDMVADDEILRHADAEPGRCTEQCTTALRYAMFLPR